jgi:eukaryotic-like serine/threonine-protein kinase
MALDAGTHVGPYEVLAKLGEGGMGEVYRARGYAPQSRRRHQDPARTLVADPERVARFEREAHLLAALNHPHIAGIYGLEDAGGSSDRHDQGRLK